MPQNGNRYELIGGEVYVTPSPNTKHRSVLHPVLSHEPADPEVEVPISRARSAIVTPLSSTALRTS